MSASQPTLYGVFAYARGAGSSPTLYAEGFVPQIQTLALADSAPTSDSDTARVTKALAELIVSKEWIALNLIHALIWVNPQVNENQVDTLYARSSIGPVLYGATKTLFGGVKPTSTWTSGSSRPENWSQAPGHKYNY